MLDAVKLPPLLHTSSVAATSSSSLTSSSSPSFCARGGRYISDDWQGAKQHNHLWPPAEIEAFHDALLNYTSVLCQREKGQEAHSHFDPHSLYENICEGHDPFSFFC